MKNGFRLESIKKNVLEIKPRLPSMLGKHFPTVFQLQPWKCLTVLGWQTFLCLALSRSYPREFVNNIVSQRHLIRWPWVTDHSYVKWKCVLGSSGRSQDYISVLHELIFTMRCAAWWWKEVRLLDGQPFSSPLIDDVPAPAAPFDHRIVMAKHSAVDSLFTVSKSEILGGWVRLSLNNVSVKVENLPKAEPKKCSLVLTQELQTLKNKHFKRF